MILCVGLAIREGRSPAGLPPLEYDSAAYDYIPEGWPLSDPRKAGITVRQLMHHVAGILPECTGVSNNPSGCGFWEFALGLGPFPTAHLHAEPGTKFLYGTYDMRHLCLVLHGATGQELDDYIQRRILDPCGIERWRMDRHGGNGSLGPHADVRMYTTAAEFARLGYLMLAGGRWAGRQVLPAELMQETFTRRFPGIVPDHFTYHWLGKHPAWPDVIPDDLFYTFGAGVNICAVAPSLDLVFARVGDAYGADHSQAARDLFVRLFSAVEGAPDPPPDTSAPRVAVAHPTHGAPVSGEVEIQGTADDEDEVCRVEVDIDGAGDPRPAQGTARWSYGWDTRTVVDGLHRIVVRAYDRAGNVSQGGRPVLAVVANGGNDPSRRLCG
jgi:CubicO group peptidase (beta-lactamase class C family)